jgi:hypothetical protein
MGEGESQFKNSNVFGSRLVDITHHFPEDSAVALVRNY